MFENDFSSVIDQRVMIHYSLWPFEGYIEIKKASWTEFTYNCYVNNILIKEATQQVENGRNTDIFDVKITDAMLTVDENSNSGIKSESVIYSLPLLVNESVCDDVSRHQIAQYH
jgi:hypothetical protein